MSTANLFANPSPASSISENSSVDAKSSAANLQRVTTLQTALSKSTRASHHVPGVGRGRRTRGPYKRDNSTRLLDEFELHFHESPLGFFESYFAENDQQDCTSSRQNHPGRVLSDDSPSSEEDSDDEEDSRACEDQGRAAISSSANEGESKCAQLGRSAAPNIPAQSGSARSNVKAIEKSAAAEIHGASPHTDDDEESDADHSAVAEVDVERPAFVLDHDLFEDRWYPDPWNRAPGQTRTKEIQNELDLCGKLRERGFSGRRAALIAGMLHKRKGYRFPYRDRLPMRKSGQRHTEYLAALKQRKADEKSLENQVKIYDKDEAKAIAECEIALSLFDLVYGADWPEEAKQTNLTPPQTPGREGNRGSDYEDEPVLKRRKTREHISTPEIPETEKANDRAVPHEPPGQTASAREIEERNRQFRAYKAEVMYETRKRRDEKDVKEFQQGTEFASFSNGYREIWKETA